MERWLGKVAVITGASVGIGAATALTLAEAGFKVVGLARRVELVEELRSKLSSDAKGALFARKCDISKEEDIKGAFDWIIQQFGGVDVLINNAAVFHISPLTGPDAAKLLGESLDTNVMAVVLCTREAYQSMKSRGTPGHVIHINALLGHRIPYVPNTFFNVYPPTKYALTALTEVHRQEFLNDGSKVKVTSISPGVVATAMRPSEISHLPSLNPEDVAETILYVLKTPPNVLITELGVQSIDQTI